MRSNDLLKIIQTFLQISRSLDKLSKAQRSTKSFFKKLCDQFVLNDDPTKSGKLAWWKWSTKDRYKFYTDITIACSILFKLERRAFLKKNVCNAISISWNLAYSGRSFKVFYRLNDRIMRSIRAKWWSNKMWKELSDRAFLKSFSITQKLFE